MTRMVLVCSLLRSPVPLSVVFESLLMITCVGGIGQEDLVWEELDCGYVVEIQFPCFIEEEWRVKDFVSTFMR